MDAVAVCSVYSEFKDDNVKYPNYVPRDRYCTHFRPASCLSYCFSLAVQKSARNDLSREILPKLQLRKKLTTIIRMRLIKILLT